MKKRILSIVVALAMCLTMLPSAALAAGKADTGLCAHHAEHTAACGYAAPTEGAPCTHEHDESCGYAAAAAEVPCDKDCADTDGDGVIEHAENCAYAPSTEERICQHVHDEACGYAEASVGAPCQYVCGICAVQELIDDLPDADSITADSADDVAAQLTAIDEAKLALTDEEMEQLDLTLYVAASNALLALEGEEDAGKPMPLDGGDETVSSITVGGNEWSASTYAKTDDTGAVTPVDASADDYNIYWNAATATLTLKDVNISVTDASAISAQLDKLTILLEGKNTITAQHTKGSQSKENLSAISNSGEIEIKADSADASLAVKVSQTGELCSSAKVTGIYTGTGLTNSAKISIEVTAIDSKKCSGELYGIECGVSKSSSGFLKNSGDIIISIENNSLT